MPDLRALMQRHYYNASLWSDGLNDDPRIKPAHSAPGIGLNALVRDLPKILGRRPRRSTSGSPSSVCRPNTPGSWRPTTCMMTRHLIADLDNALDWLRPRILAVC